MHLCRLHTQPMDVLQTSKAAVSAELMLFGFSLQTEIIVTSKVKLKTLVCVFSEQRFTKTGL